MATDPNRFIALGAAPALANEIAKAIDEAATAGVADTELTVTLTGAVTGTDTAKISDGLSIATTSA
jgi:hypothetical protein